MILGKIKNKLNVYKEKRKWRASNANNDTFLINIETNISKITFGHHTYGGLDVANDTEKRLVIGSYCSIAENVKFLVGIEHRTDTISTYPFGKLVMGTGYEATSKGDVIIGDDVWIGYGSIILSGVSIGQGAVIAAGAVVTKDIPPYAIVVGVPAKVIKYRFSQPIIDKLLKIDFSKLTEDMIREHIDGLYQTVDENTDLTWLPMKD